MDGREIEIKLGIDAAAMGWMKRHSLLTEHRLAPPTTLHLVSVYWDTPERTLEKAGITVRVRTIGRRHLQTVKLNGHSSGGLFSRQEWEAPVASALPDPLHLRTTDLPVLQDVPLLSRLTPIFTTDVRRTCIRLGETDWELELALDRGEIRSNDRSLSVSELELELIRGDRTRLFALAQGIAAAFPVRLVALAKSDRGYRLAAGPPVLAAVKSKATMLRPEMTVASAFQSIVGNCLEQLVANQPALLEARHHEAVHQMRVALRRLRSALKVFRKAVTGADLPPLVVELRWLLEHLGPARDDHVFLTEVIDPVVTAHPDHGGLETLRGHWAERREHSVDTAIAAVSDRRFTCLVLALTAWAETGDWLHSDNALLTMPIRDFARRQLSRRDRRLATAGGKDLAVLTPDELHQARILGKQVRYAGEFFAPLWGQRAPKRFLAILAELQDRLGQLNDIAVAHSRLAAEPMDWASGLVAGWHAGQRPRLLVEAAEIWTRYRTEPRFWKKSP